MRMQLAFDLAAQRAQEHQIRVKRYKHAENVHA